MPIHENEMHIAGDGDALADGHVAVYDVPVLGIVIQAPRRVIGSNLRGAVAGLLRWVLRWVYIGNILLS